MEVVPGNRPPTRKQKQLIAKLVKDFPDTKTLYEYEDYVAIPTKVNASAFITLALETNWDSVIQSEQYMKYIATRPRAERFGSHGLFSDDDTVSLDKAMTELENYTGNVWTHIISLKREDAERLGYNNASAWRDLLRAHRNQIADAMKIHPNDFRWYAAFHDEGDHPHVHMMAWSAKPGQAYLSKDGIKAIKSKLTNDIFHDEMHHLYEQKTESRDELVHEARKAMLEMVQYMKVGICDHPEAENLMLELAMQLQNVSGKKSYGYLPKKQKALVDKIVDQMERIRSVSQAYGKWLELQNKVDEIVDELAKDGRVSSAYALWQDLREQLCIDYNQTPPQRVPLSQQKEFRAIKNAVIKQAEHIWRCDLFFEDKGVEAESEPEDFEYCSRDYWDYRGDIYNENYSLEDRLDAVNDMEQLAREGDMDAQYLMGKLYRDGPLLTPDSVEAKYWFTQAAQQGHMYAQYSLGKLYLSDDVDVHDTERGMHWLEVSAQNGNDYAAYRLGKEYYKGNNTPRSYATAAQWFERAAQDGNQYAQYMLGKVYLMGQGVEYNQKLGRYWLTKSAYQGNVYADALLNRQNSDLPPNVFLGVTRLLHHMGRIFQDNSLPQSRPGGIQIDRKRLKRLQEKKIALGHKEDDHEYTGPTMSM